MKYTPFTSLASTRYVKTLRTARLATKLGIYGFYITLAIAGIVYLTAEGSSALLTVNQVLVNGVLTSFGLIASGCSMAVLVAISSNQN
ncbi:hypothetical protein FLL45_18085 [Aliikangiella marina]|uniref:Uncharacterized protein n=1 Tax=Aliikangiella marina TaxID=1712262 RepID=A0A545T4I3_9GAMM|nr:hypothetical protein [Aliikangiella marina]TQV72130.1 hypothetical protein FLL45_18085 [Aliikangiella marina]